MSYTPKNPLAGIIAAIITAELLAARATTPAPKRPGGLPPDLAEILPPELRAIFSEKCGDPTCDGCYPSNGEQPTAASGSNANPVGQGQESTTEGEARVHVSDVVEITPEIAELTGVGAPGFDPESLEGHTRLLAAAFINNVRALGERPMKNFHEAGAALSGIAYAEKSVLSALRTFTELSK